jgi:RNA polymerase sigma-70 factor (ECF subfamily)
LSNAASVGAKTVSRRLLERASAGPARSTRETRVENCDAAAAVSTMFLLGAAEDVQQQVFLEVWRRSDSLDSERGRLLAWVMTIARSRAMGWRISLDG